MILALSAPVIVAMSALLLFAVLVVASYALSLARAAKGLAREAKASQERIAEAKAAVVPRYYRSDASASGRKIR